jgi:hypothetical protein
LKFLNIHNNGNLFRYHALQHFAKFSNVVQEATRISLEQVLNRHDWISSIVRSLSEPALSVCMSSDLIDEHAVREENDCCAPDVRAASSLCFVDVHRGLAAGGADGAGAGRDGVLAGESAEVNILF